MTDFITAAVCWPHGFNDFSVILSIPSLLIALTDWFLTLTLNYVTFFATNCTILYYKLVFTICWSNLTNKPKPFE